jgi:hypothetical protein
MMIDDEKAIKSFEKESRDHKEIHGRNTFSLVRYKSHPFVDFIPGGFRSYFGQIPGYTSLTNNKSQFQ